VLVLRRRLKTSTGTARKACSPKGFDAAAAMRFALVPALVLRIP
jgi:hypothetical protein